MADKERIDLLTKKYNFVNKLLIAHGIEHEDREDLLHEIYILAFKSLDQLSDMDKIESWLWKITENRLNLYRKEYSRKRYAEVSLEEDELEQRLSNLQHAINLDHVTKAIDEMATREELRSALCQLDRETLTILNLHYGLEYRLTEISEAQEKNYSSVKSTHARGLQKLRKIILRQRALENS